MDDFRGLFPKGSPKQYAWFALVFIVWFTGFLILVGEVDVSNPIPIFQLVIIKLVGLAMFSGAVALGAYLEKKNLLPECNENKED